ncbi:DnaJ domain-containing protein [Spiroplasma tabanidicola]|uniref:J domain-containing protein n=1 Tax=Spiroplasma tabanidicola TaxID=324079 RepID=A0A6I6C487_9MOLU|nr:DnaJ domain-containing protein [Spiroplasma tabanidicola]QGS51637.1 hypothetical protein STABA_v1c02710 [Spiroplasma tabanidicola]
MGWKKEFKKFQKEFNKKSSIFNNSFDESSFIEWERASQDVYYWTIENILAMIESYNLEIKEFLNNQLFPNKLEEAYNWRFISLDYNEEFTSYPCTSFFEKTYDFLNKKIGSYGATLVISACTKYCYYTTIKFWKVFNATFSNKNINDKTLLRVFEVMQRTALDAIECIVEKALLLIADIDIVPYKHHLLVEEIIDLGDDFTYHWSRMFDQVVDLTLETYIYQKDFNETIHSFTQEYYNNIDETDGDFEDFFEKTKTLVFNDEVNDAFNYFGISKMDRPSDFKKIYRKLAKQFHPDVNPDPNAAIEMKKINMFKTIIEQYYEKYEIV